MSVPARPISERFWPKVNRVDGSCWEWTGAKDGKGYGRFWVTETRRAVVAHRVAYELLVGPIPEGLTLDHLCRNTGCVNPAHLDPCTAGENASRAPGAPYRVKAAWTHCAHGHEFTPANTATHHGRRECRACNNARAKARRAARNERAAA